MEDVDRKLFRDYCADMDKRGEWFGFVEEGDEEMMEVLGRVPCGLEFLKYVRWHTLAHRMRDWSGSMVMDGAPSNPVSNSYHSSFSMDPSFTVYYEDFADDRKTDAVVAMMASFLNLDSVDYSKRPEFVAGRMYRNGYFTEDEMGAVKELVGILLAHDIPTWDLLSGYFDF